MISVFVNSQNSEATKRNYQYDLDTWFRYLNGVQPDESSAIQYRNWLELNYAPSSAARMFNTVRQYYRFMGGANPLERIKSPKTVKNRVPKVPSDKVVEAMLRLCRDPRDTVVLALLLNGLRSEEVTRLTANDWQYEPLYSAWVISVIGKGNKARRVPATAETVQAVSGYLSRRNQSSAWLVQARGGNRMSTRQVQYVCEKYSGGKIRPHALRHHYATRLVRAGVNLIAVRDLLGHEDVQTTQIYTSLDLAGIIEAARADPRNEVGK